MALTRISRLVIVFCSSLALLGLMMASVDPEIQYSVDEIMDEPEKFQDGHIFVRGVISPDSLDNKEMRFILKGVSDEIFVDFTNSPIPDGFNEGRTIAVRGDLVKLNGIWVIDSFEIQTGCPSKYES
jgi:cytochrome c-type biogenesis protein CcmE